MKMTIKAVALVLALFVMPAAAHEINAPLDGFPYNAISEELSEDGETLDQFVVRIAPIFDEFTARTEWEACGVLAQDKDGRYGIKIGSIQAALSCATNELLVPQGMVSIGQTIHSHPRTKSVRPTASDTALLKLTGFRGAPYKAVERNPGATNFSFADYEAGPGFLIAGNRVLHQAGRGTLRTVGKLEKLAPVRKFAQR